MGADVQGGVKVSECSLSGNHSNYQYGLMLKDEEIPVGWVKTWRPCMECASAVTYIDSNKVWHCMKCGWRSDMGKMYSEEEVKVIVDGLRIGRKLTDIARDINRDYASVCQKAQQLRRKGLLDEEPEEKSAEVTVADNKEKSTEEVIEKSYADLLDGPIIIGELHTTKEYPAGFAMPSKDKLRTRDPLCDALLAAKDIGLALKAVSVSGDTASLTFDLYVGEGAKK